MKKQILLKDINELENLNQFNPLLVFNGAYELEVPFDFVQFYNFTSHPEHSQIEEGAKLYRDSNCDIIVAIGGGSTIDVGKAIKTIVGFDTQLIAVPTTAGSGSEATNFTAVYQDGIKQSFRAPELLPDIVVLQPTFLKSLPLYQKRVTMLDALCQAIESHWAKASTTQSKRYSQSAIENIMKHRNRYLKNSESAFGDMLMASHHSGKAIQLTNTTAAHALSEGLTTLYGLAHGHSVALCLIALWNQMGGFDDIANLMGCQNHTDAIRVIQNILNEGELYAPMISEEDINKLLTMVNVDLLDNHPVKLTQMDIRDIYHLISDTQEK